MASFQLNTRHPRHPRHPRYVVKCITYCLSFSLALIMTACSSPLDLPLGTPDPEATPLVIQATIFAPTETPAPSVTPPPTATPIPPKPIAVPLAGPLAGPLDTLHPFYATTLGSRTILGALFVGCVGQGEHGTPIALGCEQTPTADNGGAVFVGEGVDRHLQVTFQIRPGWRWTDGTPVTAGDAIYAWQFIMSPESNLRDRLTQSVFSMRALDDRTVVVAFMSAAQAQAAAAGTLRGDVPFEYFSQLGDYAAYAQRDRPLAPMDYWAVVRWLPAHLLRDIPLGQQRASQFAARPIGDGAFEIADAGNGRITLRPSLQAFPLGAPTVNGIEFIVDDRIPINLSESPAVMLSLPAEFATAHDSILSTVPYPSGAEQLVLNVNRFPFDDVKVRQAVAHAIDRTQLVGDASVVVAAPAVLPFDPARSKALLAQAGWMCDAMPCRKAVTGASGEVITRTLEFKLTTTEREPRNTVAQAIQKQLASVGFGVNVEIVFGAGKASRMFAPYEQGGILLTRNFDAALYQTDAPAALSGQFGCASIPTAASHDPSKGNASGFCDEMVDRLIAEAEDGESVISAQARAEAFATAQRAIHEAAPVVPLYSPLRVVYTRGVRGLKPSQHNIITWNAWEWRTE